MEHIASHPLHRYKAICRFLAEMLGSNVEIVLYDVRKEAVYHAENGFNNHPAPGDKMSGIELKLLETGRTKGKEYVVNYRNLTHQMAKLRSSAYFIRDGQGEIFGMLTVNIDVSAYVDFRGILEEQITGRNSLGAEEEADILESLDYNVENIMNYNIQNQIMKIGVNPERLTVEEKNDIIKELDSRGTFLIKGSVKEVARILNCSEVTIYRYLQNTKT